ncbi:MAG: hypothetical protein HZB67_02940 [Candidatus Aenigmarchaeota archaeon]|nr:hypothetical protein [Candidatus Aenigmarchaeota archaeon]
MKISKEMFGSIAGDVSHFLEEAKISHPSDLDCIMGQEIYREDDAYVLIESRPSTVGTTAHIISYIKPGAGIPLEIRINERIGYADVIVKGAFRVPGYEPFAQDPFGNTAQEKLLEPRIPSIRTELKNLADYCGGV